MLTAGTRLGSHEVLALLGRGGMGEVYQAHDTKLVRDVAIKLLPEAFAHDPHGCPGSSAKPSCWPRWIIPTSPPFTGWRNRTARIIW